MGGKRRMVSIGVGLLAVLVGAALTLKPFSSLDALVLYVGVSLGVAGAGEFASSGSRLAGALLVTAGALVFGLPGLTVSAIALIVGIGMVVAGVARLVGGVRGTRDERFTAVVGGIAGVVLGLLALTWPDVTILIVALLVGPLAVVLGLQQLVRVLRGPRAEEPAMRRGWRRVARGAGAVVALLLSLLLVAVSAFLHDDAPAVEGFYAARTDLPDEPGRLLDDEAFDRRVPAGATARRILYTTTGSDGKIEQVSGLVVLPRDADGPVPVVLWTHGTTGVVEKCAPSLLAEPFTAGAMFVLDEVVRRGWALVAPDYPGLGTDGAHPYLVGVPTARSALDAVRAARRLDGVRLDDRTVVWGHSQGGGAALWAGIESERYARDVPLAGVAALAPASDVLALADGLQRTPAGMLFAAFVARGYSDVYDDVKFDDYVRPAAQGLVRRAVGRCLSERETLASLGAVLTGQSIYDRNLTSGPLGRRLRENVPAQRTRIPTLIAQGLDDQLVLPPVQRAFAERLCDTGQSVDFRTYEGRDHVALVEPDSPLIPELLRWTEQRFAGRAARPRCPT